MYELDDDAPVQLRRLQTIGEEGEETTQEEEEEEEDIYEALELDGLVEDTVCDDATGSDIIYVTVEREAAPPAANLDDDIVYAVVLRDSPGSPRAPPAHRPRSASAGTRHVEEPPLVRPKRRGSVEAFRQRNHGSS